MMYSYEELKSDVANRSEPIHSYYRNFIEIFEGLYNAAEIQAMYIRNQFNQEEIETILFFSNKIVKVTKVDLHFRFIENKGSIIKKEILISKDSQRDTKLVILYDNEEVLTLDNIKDSNINMAWEYGNDIKEVFKILS